MWDEDLSRKFMQYGHYFVPAREFQLHSMTRLIPDPGEPFNVMELCCGEGLLAELILDHFPDCTVYGLDGSQEMLTAAAARLARFGKRFQPLLFDLPSPNWRAPFFQVGAVLSSLAIHHLDEGQKALLFQDVYRLLAPGGVFLIADIILPANELGMRYAAETLDDVVRRRSLELEGGLAAFQFFQRERWNFFRYPEDPLDKPSPLLAQLHWLKAAGFRQVDVFWLLAGHTVFGGVKPVGETEND
ncbi:MAG: methyltransferase domain-containing protein [Anaerolineae bacterium]|nr:methyltransferase domain-containing protein [Anaerolineae bacterium]